MTYTEYGTVYEREKLYDEVWKEPVLVVAKRYGVSNVAIKKICKRLKVPVPPLGYWAKLRAGKPVERTPLPNSTGPTRSYGPVHNPKPEIPAGDVAQPLAFLHEVSRRKVLNTCQTLRVAERLVNPHRLILQDQQVREAQKQREDEERQVFAQIFGAPTTAQAATPFRAFLDLRVPDEGLDRAYRLLHSLFHAIEQLGGTIYVDTQQHSTSLIIEGEPVRVKLTGSNLNFTLVIDEVEAPRKHWRDTKRKRLESEVGSFILGVYECAYAIRTQREEREQKERQRQREEQQRIALAQRQQEELARYHALEQAAMDWHKARLIDSYLTELERRAEVEMDATARAALMQHIAWAKEKVAWLDPMVKRKDPVLGERIPCGE